MLRPIPAAIAATATLAAAVLAVPVTALGQTVADYRESLHAAPILEAPADTAAAYCRPLQNFVYVSIPTWELKQPWLMAVLPFEGTPDPEIAKKRETCLDHRNLSIIQFDDGSGQEIVTPPSLDDPERAYTTSEPRPLPPL